MPPLESSIKKQGASDKVQLSRTVTRTWLIHPQAPGTDLSGSRSSTPVPGQEASSIGRAADDDKCLQQCALLMQDIKEMERAILQLWVDTISNMLPPNVAEENESSRPEGE